MKRAWVLLAVMSALAALGLSALARAPRAPQPASVERPRPQVAVRLEVEQGAVSPATTIVRKGQQVHLGVTNRGPAGIRFGLSGYEDRVTATRIPPDSTWGAVFLADRPGDEFEWLVDGRPAGRFIVLGSHLEEGHE